MAGSRACGQSITSRFTTERVSTVPTTPLNSKSCTIRAKTGTDHTPTIAPQAASRQCWRTRRVQDRRARKGGSYATNEAQHEACGGFTYGITGRFRGVWRRVPGTSRDSHDPSYPIYAECEYHWPLQSGADLHEWTRDDKYLYKLYANRNDIWGSGKYARLPIE